MLNTLWKVDSQHVDRGTTDRSLALKLGTVPLKVIFPSVRPRAEEWRELFCLRVVACGVRSLETVAIEARKSKVIRDCRAVVVLRPDVIDAERQWIEVLLYAAILTRFIRTRPDLLTKLCFHSRWDVSSVALLR